MITIIDKPKDLVSIGGFIIRGNGINTFDNAHEAISHCLDTNIHIRYGSNCTQDEVIFTIESKQDYREYEVMLHWISGYYLNMKIKPPKVTVVKDNYRWCVPIKMPD